MSLQMNVLVNVLGQACGLSFVGFRLWAFVCFLCGLSFVDFRLWAFVCGLSLSTKVHKPAQGFRRLDFPLWAFVCGLSFVSFVGFRLWTFVCGPTKVQTKVQRVRGQTKHKPKSKRPKSKRKPNAFVFGLSWVDLRWWTFRECPD